MIVNVTIIFNIATQQGKLEPKPPTGRFHLAVPLIGLVTAQKSAYN